MNSRTLWSQSETQDPIYEITFVWRRISLLGIHRGQRHRWALIMYDIVTQADCNTAEEGGGGGSQCLVSPKKREVTELHMNVMAAWLITVTCLVVAVTCRICTRSIELKFEKAVLRKLIWDQPLHGYESDVLQWILDIRKILCSPTPPRFGHTISTKVHLLPACGTKRARESERCKTRGRVWPNSIKWIQTPRLAALWIDCVSLRHAFIVIDHCTLRCLCFLLILISFMLGKSIVSHAILTYIDTLLILCGLGTFLAFRLMIFNKLSYTHT